MRTKLIALFLVWLICMTGCAMGTHTRAEVAELATNCHESHIQTNGKRVRPNHLQIREDGSRNWVFLCAFPDQNLAAETYDVRKRDPALFNAVVAATSPVVLVIVGYAVFFGVLVILLGTGGGF